MSLWTNPFQVVLFCINVAMDKPFPGSLIFYQCCYQYESADSGSLSTLERRSSKHTMTKCVCVCVWGGGRCLRLSQLNNLFYFAVTNVYAIGFIILIDYSYISILLFLFPVFLKCMFTMYK